MPSLRTRTACAVSTLVVTAASAGLVPLRATATTTDAHALDGFVVEALAVSPAYARTGLVVAAGAMVRGCTAKCNQVWLSHDGGATWTRAAAKGWDAGNPVIAVDGRGREVLFSGTSEAVQRSDDLGATWSDVGGGGIPAASPAYASDRLVAVAGASDYTLRNGVSSPVKGSGGAMTDSGWAFAPASTSGSTQPALLLAGVDSARKPAVARCNRSFSCGSPVALPVADSFAGAPTLATSSAFALDGTVFANTAEGLFKSTDGGGSFAAVTPPMAGVRHLATVTVALSPRYQEAGPDRRVWEAVVAFQRTAQGEQVTGDLFASRDGGATWTGAGAAGPFAHGATAVAVAPDGRVFAGIAPTLSGGLLCSTDANHWAAACPAMVPQVRSASAVSGASTGACAGTGCAARAQPQGMHGAAAGGVAAAAAGANLSPASKTLAGPGGGLLPLAVIAAVAGLLVAAVLARALRRRRAQPS